MLAPPVLLALLALASPPRQEPASFGEGELENTAAFQVSTRANELLAEADAALVELRAGSVPAADRERTWNAIFDAWRDAVVACAADEWVDPDPALFVKGRSAAEDPDATNARRAEGVEAALVRRVARLAPSERAAWAARCDARAAEELARARDEPRGWIEVERAYPATAHAARAALKGFDHAFESGRSELARCWLARAELHVELAVPTAGPFPAALARRRAALERLAPPPDPGVSPLDAARGFGRVRATIYDDSLEAGFDAQRARQMGIDSVRLEQEPGIARLTSGSLVIESNGRLAILSARADDPVTIVDPRALVAALDLPRAGRARLERAPGRSATPVALGDELLLALGADAAAPRSCLARLAFPTSVLALEPTPRLRWAVAGGQHLDARGRRTLLPQELDLRGLDFQPGPVVAATQAVWLARGTGSELGAGTAPERGVAATYAVALELESGRPLWKRRLAYGPVGPKVVEERFGLPLEVDLAPLELAEQGGWILAGTHTGFAVLLDAADGRLAWSLRLRRRHDEAPGWLGRRPLDAGDGSWVLAPCDSDRGYRLRAAADLDGRGVLLDAPFEIGELRTILHAEGARILAVTGDGDRERLAWIDLESGERVHSVALARGERFANRAAVSPRRVLVATDRGLALFDRERELYLLDRSDLAAPVVSALATGDGVVALGYGVLWRVDLR